VQAPTPSAVAAGFWGAPVAEGDRARPSIAATPRSRQLLEQGPSRPLQELVALDDPKRTWTEAPFDIGPRVLRGLDGS
jgi:hypothetical protein